MLDYNTVDIKNYLYKVIVNDHSKMKQTAFGLSSFLSEIKVYDADIEPVLYGNQTERLLMVANQTKSLRNDSQ